MIQFFRRIRFDLMGKNKTGKYLKYAIGEIILVVIGILIALQLNNWNSDHKASIEELELLTEMKFNLEKDMKDCIWNINKNKELYNSKLVYFAILKNECPLLIRFINIMEIF